MKGDQEATSCSPVNNTKKSLNEGLLMVPNAAVCLLKTSLTKHKRAGSTGTTGDESYTTDEDDLDVDEPDITIRDHVTRKLFSDHDPGAFNSFSDICTITDKVRHMNVMHRNSSDSSVLSDEADSDSKSGASSAEVCLEGNDAFIRLQNELKEANHELKLRDQELSRLSRIRQDVEAELEDLTASLFQVRIKLYLITYF